MDSRGFFFGALDWCAQKRICPVAGGGMLGELFPDFLCPFSRIRWVPDPGIVAFLFPDYIPVIYV
jgi:hypothetical protein